MAITYRATTYAALAGFLCALGREYLRVPIAGLESLPAIEQTAALGWDPCSVWEQIPITVRLAFAVWLGSFAALVVQGLRNHPAPRWVAIVGLLSLGITIHHDWWRLTRCYSTTGTAMFVVWVLAFALMSVHQVLRLGSRRASTA